MLSALLLGSSLLPASAQTVFRTLSFDDALAAAKKEKKMVFIDFYTDWCGPCKKMAREVFPQKSVGDYFNGKFVCLKLNAEKEGKELAKKYNVKAYPTYVVIDTDGKQRLEACGAMEPEAFISKIDGGLDPDRAPERMKQLYEEGKRTPELINNYALYLMEQRKEDEGFKVVNDYFRSLSDSQRLKADNAFLFTRYTLNLDDDKAKFLLANHNRFDKKAKDAIDARIQLLCHNALTSFFSGYLLKEKKYKEEDYQQLKSLIKDLGLDKSYAYAPMFRLIESRTKDDDQAFLTNCATEYDRLCTRDRTLLILNLTRLIDTKDKTVLKQISTFVRKRLADMDANTIALAGRLLSSIEQ